MAIASGVEAATAQWIVTIDGDGQNDPADIASLIAIMDHSPDDVWMVAGYRTSRDDGWLRRIASRVANSTRRLMLHDAAPDSACGIKLFSREAFLALPRFDHMHRFLPALIQRQGGRVLHVSVKHRARIHGRSKYGILDRLWVGIVDLFGVMWLQRRAVCPEIEKEG
jgi:dolichol-phosphate mannosyltransferase